MILTIKLSDEVYQKYVEHSRTNPRAGIEKQLERFQDLAPGARVLVFPDQAWRDLEGLFGTTIEYPQKFVDWVRERLSVAIEGVQVPLRPGQLKHLRQQAETLHVPFGEWLINRMRLTCDREFGPY